MVVSLRSPPTLSVNCEEGGASPGKPGLYRLDPGQVHHEGGSCAGPEVDDQRLASSRHTEQPHLGPGPGLMEDRVRGRTIQLS